MTKPLEDRPEILDNCQEHFGTMIQHAVGTKIHHITADLDRFRRDVPSHEGKRIARRMLQDVRELEAALRYAVDQIHN